MDKATLQERINHNLGSARFPKKEITPVYAPTAQVSNKEWNNAMGIISETAVRLYGGTTYEYKSVKQSPLQMQQNHRIYTTGYVLSGGDKTTLLSFSVGRGDKFQLSGLMNDTNNDSLCWAIYNDEIELANNQETADALAAAMIDGDSESTPGRSNVNTEIVMPTGAKMLVVSIPFTNDASTIEKYASKAVSGIDNDLKTLKGALSVDVKSLLTAVRNRYGLKNNGRITMDGKVTHGEDGCTTYIIALSAFTDKKFSADGLANSTNNDSLCWAVYNIPESSVDWSDLTSGSYQLDWSNYLMESLSDPEDTAGRTNVSLNEINLNNTSATFLVVSCKTSTESGCSIENHDSEIIDNLQSQIDDLKVEAEKAAELIVLKNHIGVPSGWGARTTATSGNSTAVMTLGDTYANVKVTSSAASSGERAMWLGLYARNVVAGHKYIMITRYRVSVGLGSILVFWYYNSSVEWSDDGFVRIRVDDNTDKNVWKYDVGSQYFTAPSSGDLWLDFVVKVSDTISGAGTDVDFDILPMLFDITGTGFDAESMQAILEKTGSFFSPIVVAPYSIAPFKSSVAENMITLGDSTTGMMLWQTKLAQIKGWNWDARSNGGLEFNGVGAPYTAMGIGSTHVEPIICGGGAFGPGYSHYIRARYVKNYNPSIIFVMSSYNGAHNGEHWAGDSSMPVQPDDYGLAALKASGMDTAKGTYAGTYFGDEVNLLEDPTQEVPSFAASYFGMIYRLIVDNPAARIVLITLMDDFDPSNSAYLDLKNKVIEHAAEVFHLPLIDANHCGINRTNRLTTRYDQGGVHFNENGGLLLAKHIAANC